MTAVYIIAGLTLAILALVYLAVTLGRANARLTQALTDDDWDENADVL